MPRTRKQLKEANQRFARLEKVAKRFDAWRPAKDVLTNVRAVSTIFTDFNRATRVGGWPVGRFGLIHGPSNHGKTIFVHGLGLSFLQAGHFYAYVDAEHTTPETWLRDLMHAQATNPGFVALRPVTYEETVDAVRDLVEKVAKARNDGDLDEGTTALIVIDSIRKLVPKNLLAKIMKHGADGTKGSIDGAGGRAAQMRAALNAQWLDELTPLLAHTNTSMVFISRETEDPEADANDRRYGNDFKVGGGKALVFDSSLVCRITRAAWVREGTDEKSRVIGEKHRVRIWKTKVGGKEGKHEDAFFHTSNGSFIPPGYDPARDMLDQALERGAVKQKGSWYSTSDGEKLAQGKNAVVKYLYDHPDTLAELESQCQNTTAEPESATSTSASP